MNAPSLGPSSCAPSGSCVAGSDGDALSQITAMTDVIFLRAFERGEIAPAEFHHLCHLRVAAAYLRESVSFDQAAAKMRDALRRFAAAAGAPRKYHETITQFWLRLLAAASRQEPGAGLEQLVATYPQLLEKNLPRHYYSAERLGSDAARREWIEPDLKPLPD